MEPDQVLSSFEIPAPLAHELSDLLTKQTIKMNLLMQILDKPNFSKSEYDALEDTLVPITARIEAIKLKITKEYVPKEYCSPEYMWNYDGFEVAGNMVDILSAK
jgi:hypothetical protein